MTQTPPSPIQITLHFISYGLKYTGEANTLISFDLRSVPHPKGIKLKGRTGLEKEIFTSVFNEPRASAKYNTVVQDIRRAIHQYCCEPKDNVEEDIVLKIGVGCNSGKHRSVAFVERLKFETWHVPSAFVIVDCIGMHRDIHRKAENVNGRRKAARARKHMMVE